MFTAKQFRAKAAESAESLKHTDVPSEIRELQRSRESFAALAANEDWLADNFDKIIRSQGAHPQDGSAGKPAARATGPEVEEHILRCLGAAVILQWNTIPTKLQRELFDTAGSMGDVLKSVCAESADCPLPAYAQRRRKPRRLRIQTNRGDRNISCCISSISVRSSSLSQGCFDHRPRAPTKFVISFRPRTVIRATLATGSRTSLKSMNESRLKAISHSRPAFSGKATGADSADGEPQFARAAAR